MRKLTDRQREVFDFIREHIHERRLAPTFQEIADHFGFTLRTAMQYLDVLQKKGFLSRETGKPRTIVLAQDYFSVRVNIACPDQDLQVGDTLIVCRSTRPVAGDRVVVERDDGMQIETFQGQEPIIGKVIALYRKV